MPDSLVVDLLDSDSDWVVQSYALRKRSEKLPCLLISDGTEFAAEIGTIARDAGFHVVTLPTSLGRPFELSELQEDSLRTYVLAVVIRGEHFMQHGNEESYNQLRKYVAEGESCSPRRG